MVYRERGECNLTALPIFSCRRFPGDTITRNPMMETLTFVSSSKLRFSFDPGQRCDTTLQKILESLRKTVAASVAGVIGDVDVDVEFLHDLRVACRRARSALNQMKSVLPQPEADALSTELRWLGEVTNSCRDLDVFLLEMDDYRLRLGDDSEALDNLEKLLQRERSKALRRVRGALRSKRFACLMEEWRSLVQLQPADPEAPNAARPIADLAGKKILKAYRKMVKRGTGLGDSLPPEDFHRLRIDAKKLRYLLEFFGSLYPGKTISRLVEELKQFQDILGGFNDMVVQQRHLAAFTEALMAEGPARADTMFTMGRLADEMAARQTACREAFSERFHQFVSDHSRQLYYTTFGGD